MNAPCLVRTLTVLAVTAVTMLSGCETTRTVESEPEPVQRSGWPSHSTGGEWVWTHMAFPTGDPDTSAIGIEKGVPREARLNQPFDYELIVTNLTNLTLEDVVVSDQVDASFKVSKSVPQGQTAGGAMTWALGDFRPHESKVIRVSGAAGEEQTIASCVSATYQSMLCSTIPVVAPKLKLVKTGPAEVMRCEDIVYNYEVTNTGTGTLTNVRINDELADGLETSDATTALTINAGTLNAGQTKQFSTRLRADKTGRFETKASASGDGNITADSAMVATVVRQPTLTLAVNCTDFVYLGRALDYELTVTNTGDGVARDVVVTDTLSNGTTYVSSSDNGSFSAGKVNWNIGPLQPKASKTIRFSANPSAIGSYNNTAAASAFCAQVVTQSCRSEVGGIPAILLEVVDIHDPVKIGDNETYEITVTNQGSATDTNIKIVATLEANQTYVSSSGPTPGSVAGSTVTFAPLPTLGVNEKATYRVVVKAVKAGDVRFKATMNTDQLSRNVEETEATNVYE